MLAKGALHPIQRKLRGIYSTSKERQGQEISTSNLVQILIQEASSPANLVSLLFIQNLFLLLTEVVGKNVPWMGCMELNIRVSYLE